MDFLTAGLALVIIGVISITMLSIQTSSAQMLQDLSCTDCVKISDSKTLEIHKSLRLPIILWAANFDYTYDHNSIITINGHSKLNNPDAPITITVTNPIGNIVTIDQLMVKPNDDFQITFNTNGPLWKKDGTYIIKAQGGAASTIFKTNVQLTGASPSGIQCSENELNANGYCIPYTISGASVSSATLNPQAKSIVIILNDAKGGTLTINPSSSIIKGIFTVLIDGEESNDVNINENQVSIMFPKDATEIEIVGTFVIPEFGTLTMLILVIAIISSVVILRHKQLHLNQFSKFQ